MLRRISLGALLLLTSTRWASAGERWISLRSPNFELYTSSDENSARDALVFFEQVRRAFTEILGVKLPDSKTVAIIAFRNPEEYAHYRPQDNVAAYSMFLSTRDCIVMQDLVPDHYPVALHEFTHVITRQANLKMPLWLNEGFAELYSTLKPVGKKIVVGRVIEGRLQVAQGGLLDLREVLRADNRSPVYHENGRAGTFYAESWALVHMLKFSDKYASRFDQVLDAIGRGESGEQALPEVYGKTLEQIQADLAAYVHGSQFREGVINGKLEKPVAEPKSTPLDPVDMAVILAMVQVRGPQRQAALATLAELSKANPERPGPDEALAWIRLAGPEPQTAVPSFLRALEAGTRDANLCFQFAVKLRAVITETDYVAALQRAAEIDPGFSAAQQLLAAHAFNSHDYAEAVKRFHLVKKLDRKEAFKYYRALSFAAFQIGDLTEARSAAARTQEYAVAPEDRQLADEMLRYVNGGKTPATTPGYGETPPLL
jgi:hypothetical protein